MLGVDGKRYAQAREENPEVAEAIEEQWLPKSEGDALPHTTTGIILSLADKIDNLLSCFILNLKPTSSSDPYALRRQVLGIIRILIEKKYRLNIIELFRQCLSHFDIIVEFEPKHILNDLRNYFINRIKNMDLRISGYGTIFYRNGL